MSAQDKLGSFLSKAKMTAGVAGAQAGSFLQAGQARLNQELNNRSASRPQTRSTTTHAPSNSSNQLPSASSAMMSLDNKLQFDLGAECDKAARILEGFLHPFGNQQLRETEVGKRKLNTIPGEVIKRARGLAVFTVLKAGFMFSGRIGSGVVFARLQDGSWSAPSCIATGGVGYGFQIGADLTEVVVVLNSDAAVQAFSKGGNVTIGGNISASAGPVGTGAQLNSALQQPAAMFSYTRSKGLFAGVSIEGTALIERKEANREFYGSVISAREILGGNIPAPERANRMYEVVEAAEGQGQVQGQGFVQGDGGYH